MIFLKKKYISLLKKDTELLLFCLPALILVVVFVYIPLAEGFNIAFYDWDGLSNDAKFVGLQNFIDLFSDRTFGKAVSFPFCIHW